MNDKFKGINEICPRMIPVTMATKDVAIKNKIDQIHVIPRMCQKFLCQPGFYQVDEFYRPSVV